MRALRLILVFVLSFALPFQGYALAGMRACNMSHAPIERTQMERQHQSMNHAAMDHSSMGHDSMDHHGNHVSSDSSCQCSASCIGTGLMSEYPLVELQQARPVYEQIHSESVLQAPIKRLDRPPRLTLA